MAYFDHKASCNAPPRELMAKSANGRARAELELGAGFMPWVCPCACVDNCRPVPGGPDGPGVLGELRSMSVAPPVFSRSVLSKGPGGPGALSSSSGTKPPSAGRS